jgi:hypothetical protein
MKDEDIKLKEAVLMYGGRNWAAIAAQVPGRTRKQCHNRSTVRRKEEHGTLKKAPALVQDPDY